MVFTGPLYNSSPSAVIETFPLKSLIISMTNEVFCSTVTFKPVTSAVKSALSIANVAVSLLSTYLLSPAKVTLTS